jgi:hypothetical protein
MKPAEAARGPDRRPDEVSFVWSICLTFVVVVVAAAAVVVVVVVVVSAPSPPLFLCLI